MFHFVLQLSIVLYVDVGENRAILDNLSLSFVSRQYNGFKDIVANYRFIRKYQKILTRLLQKMILLH